MQKTTFTRLTLASAVLMALTACGSSSGDSTSADGTYATTMGRGDAPGTVYSISTKNDANTGTGSQSAQIGENSMSNDLLSRRSGDAQLSGTADASAAPAATAQAAQGNIGTATVSAAPTVGSVGTSTAMTASSATSVAPAPVAAAPVAAAPVAAAPVAAATVAATPVAAAPVAAAPVATAPAEAAPTPVVPVAAVIDAAASATASASTSTSAEGLAPAGATAGSFGNLSFREEWNGTVDTGKWSTRLWYWTTQELDNWKVENGVLKMWTPRDANGNFEFNNRCMNTDGMFSQRYGWFEMEAKLPPGPGQWPSFWLYAHNDDSRPELDIMEAYAGEPSWGDAQNNPIDYGATVWMSNADSTADRQIAHQRLSQTRPGLDLSAGFHKYAMKWEPDGITYYFDGEPIGPKIMTTEFNQQMYIIVGLGTGRPGGFNPPTAATATTEAGAMEVNYVRAWALPSGTTTGGTHANPAGN